MRPFTSVFALILSIVNIHITSYSDLSYFINVKKYKGWPTTGDGPQPVTLP